MADAVSVTVPAFNLAIVVFLTIEYKMYSVQHSLSHNFDIVLCTVITQTPTVANPRFTF